MEVERNTINWPYAYLLYLYINILKSDHTTIKKKKNKLKKHMKVDWE